MQYLLLIYDEETREQLGGVYLIEAKNLDEAVAIAAASPAPASAPSRCGR